MEVKKTTKAWYWKSNKEKQLILKERREQIKKESKLGYNFFMDTSNDKTGS